MRSRVGAEAMPSFLFSLLLAQRVASFVPLGNGCRNAFLLIRDICQASWILLARHKPAKVKPSLTGDGLKPFQLAEGIRVIIDPEIEQWVILLVVDQQGG